MKNNIKNEFKFKLAGTIIYFVLSLAGLSILFIFPPRKLLFNSKSKNYNTKIFLFKEFVRSIYENINKPFIQNISLINENNNESCNDEELIIKHQHYGNFSSFYGKGIKFCIQRVNNSNYNYENLLKSSNECGTETINCAKINREHNIPLCMENEDECPINHFEFAYSTNYKYHYPFPGSTFSTGIDKNRPIIVDFDIINNPRFCLERFNRSKDLSCEFPDNNECFINDGAEKIENQNLLEEYRLTPNNLANWNLKIYDYKNHNFCSDKTFFRIFAIGYINFTYDNFKEFKKEFPPTDETNNSLYKTCEAFNSQKNFDIFFYLLSFILFCCSLIHFILQILLFCEIKDVRKYYLIYGIILFLLKLFSFFVMIINHYYFYLKIEKVYLILVDESRNEVLNKYKSTRNNFIIKIIFFWIIGLLIILADLIILTFTFKVKWGVDFKVKNKKKKKKPTPNDLGIDDPEKTFTEVNEKKKEDMKISKPFINGKSICIDENPPPGINRKNTNNSNNDPQILENPYVNDHNDNQNINSENENQNLDNPIYDNKCINNQSDSENFYIQSNNLKIENQSDIKNINNQNDNPWVNGKNNEKNKNPLEMDEINLRFVCKDNTSKSYLVKAKKNDSFNKVIQKLRETYNDLKDKKIKCFSYNNSNIINKEKSIKDNGLSDNSKIVMIS